MNPLLNKYKSTASLGNAHDQFTFIFDELFKLLISAQKAIKEKDYETKFKSLSLITDTLYLLKTGVDEFKDKKFSFVADKFYDSTIHRLEKLNIKCENPEEIQPVIDAFSTVRAALKVSEKE